ncbi:MAG: branched-chain amino acid ABC transporter permease [Hyphomicrobiales bacterium]
MASPWCSQASAISGIDPVNPAHEAAYVLQQVLNALQLAAFYLPLSLAFALLQAITRRIFLSFGDFAMFGSFAAVYLCFYGLLQGLGDLTSGLAALAAAMACGAALGFATARLAFGATLLRTPLAYMIASLGFGIFLEEAMRLATESRDIWVPPLFAGQILLAWNGDFPVHLAAMPALAMLASGLGCGTVFLLLWWTAFGRAWKAVAESPQLAALCGIDATQVAALTFAVSGGLAGITGWTASISYGGANFAIGMMAGFKAMFASVVGGFGTLRGAVVGTLVLVATEVLWSALFSTAYRDAAVFAVAVAILVVKPEGVMGGSDRRESEWDR